MSISIAYLGEMMGSFSPIEQRIARYFIEHRDALTATPILQGAEACQTSKSAVVRLCKRMGYSGYKDFLTSLSAELALMRHEQRSAYTDIYPGSSVQEICVLVTQNSVRALEATLQSMDMGRMEDAVQAVANAPRLDLYGVGNSGIVAQDAELKFRRIGFNAYAATDAHRQVISASTLRKGDVALLFSYYGETRDILETLEIVQRRGATAIAITRFGQSSLASKADIVLQVASTEGLIRSGAMASRLVMLGLLDMLFTAVSSLKHEQIQEELESTAAALRGKRL